MADKVFTMRIDEELLEKVRVSAEKNKRSLAKEVEFILDNFYTLNPKGSETITMDDDEALKFIEFLKKSNFFEAIERLKNNRKNSD